MHAVDQRWKATVYRYSDYTDKNAYCNTIVPFSGTVQHLTCKKPDIKNRKRSLHSNLTHQFFGDLMTVFRKMR